MNLKKLLLVYVGVLLAACQSPPIPVVGGTRAVNEMQYMSEDFNQIEYLLRLTSYSDTQQNKANLMLLSASASNDFRQVQSALQNGADINVRGNWKMTPLMNAAVKGHSELVDFLIKNGAKVDFQDDRGVTALMKVALTLDVKTAKLLLKAGANVDLQDERGETVLIKAISSRCYPLINMLLDAKAGVNLLEENGKNALFSAVNTNGYFIRSSLLKEKNQYLEVEDNKVVARLVASGININKQSNDGWSPLMVAAESASFFVVELLLKNGADVNAKDKQGLKAVDWAKFSNRVENYQLLLKYTKKNNKKRKF